MQALKDLVQWNVDVTKKSNDHINNTNLGDWTSKNCYKGPKELKSIWQNDNAPKTLSEVGQKMAEWANEEKQKQSSFLRDYQLDAIYNMGKALSHDLGAHLSLPTGAGKTLLMQGLTAFFQERLKNNNKNVIISLPTQDLVDQFYESITNWNEGSPISIDPEKIIVSHAKKIKKDHLISNNGIANGGYVLVMCQYTLTNWYQEDPMLIKNVGLLIIDEAHRISKKLKNIIENYTKLKDGPLVGFTATPSDMTRKLFPNKLFEISTNDLVKKGFLAPWFTYSMPKSYFLNDKYNTENMVKFLKERDILMTKIDPYKRSLSQTKTLIYVPSISDAENLAFALKETHFKAAMIHSKLGNDQDKNEIKRRFFLPMDNEDRLDLLVVVDMFRLGFDAAVDCVIVAKNVSDKDMLVQMRGRALRLKSLSCPENQRKVAHFFILDGANQKWGHDLVYENHEELLEYSNKKRNENLSFIGLAIPH